MRNRRSWILGLLFSLCFLVSAAAQEAGKTEKILRVPGPESENVYRRTGAEIPKFTVVESFFEHAFEVYTRGEASWNVLAHELGILPESEASRSLERAALLARVLKTYRLDYIKIRDKSPAEFTRIQMEFTRRGVHRLRDIYYTMLQELEAEGVSRNSIEGFLEEEIRPTIELIAFPTPEYEYFEVLEEFDQQPRQENRR
ncbi:MAG TPA: hypothetical protein VLU25_03775 [Acidobacteriota bacterium]|nr:hypothetical protein [Acidobacteriota bacterium]